MCWAYNCDYRKATWRLVKDSNSHLYLLHPNYLSTRLHQSRCDFPLSVSMDTSREHVVWLQLPFRFEHQTTVREIRARHQWVDRSRWKAHVRYTIGPGASDLPADTRSYRIDWVGSWVVAETLCEQRKSKNSNNLPWSATAQQLHLNHSNKLCAHLQS